MVPISIVIPIFNESKNISPLVQRIDTTLRNAQIPYEIIFVDDHSTDDSPMILQQLQQQYPLVVHIKKGEKGKAYSLLEGFSYSSFSVIVMIDGDLQYPPEEIPAMVGKLEHADIIVANRKEQRISGVRQFTSKTFHYVFGNVLHQLHCDVQSGMKVFKKEIIERVSLHPTSWTFDMEFLLKARDAGYTIAEHDIVFSKRQFGKSNVKLFQTMWEIGTSAIFLKFQKKRFFLFTPLQKEKMGIGFHYKGKQYITHSPLHIRESAFFQLSQGQIQIIFLIFALYLLLLFHNWHATLVATITLLTFLYFCDIFFNLFLITKTFLYERQKHNAPAEFLSEYPVYTILCPLYKEWSVLPQFVDAISQLDYPKSKLQVILLFEENDRETIENAARLHLPFYFQTVIVPNSVPKTKPKACNYGLQFARGEYVVIYDAEDSPEKNQLKKAVALFKESSQNIACLQARLNFYNPYQNTLTKLFTLEYSLWFDLILTGLSSIDAPIPLGGTSNHFRVSVLKNLEGWDSFNVTEDADLGIRLAKKGYRTAMLDSTTYEEANSKTDNWFQQRSRWIKGYIQTYFVHMRSAYAFLQGRKKSHLLTFQMVIGGKVISLFINPLMWAIFISYFAFRPVLGHFIETFFPAPVLYMATVSVIFGNFLYMYYYMLGAAKRQQYGLILLGFLTPIYWLMMSGAAWIAVYGLITNPHYWAKTKHGLHLTTMSLSATPKLQTVPRFSLL